MAFDSITYANSSRLQLQGDRAAVIGPKFGMQPGPFKDLVESGKYKGSIVFGQLPKGTSGMYEGGERLGEGVQSLTDVTPYRIQELPENIVHDPSGAKYQYFDKYSNKMRRTSLSADMLKEPEFKDWMRQFAQNIKDTVPEGGYLPPGTKELLPEPQAAVVPAKAISVGQKADITTTARAAQSTTKRKALTAGISYSPATETVEDNLGNVMRRSRGLGGLLGAATEASAAVAGGVSKTGALRNAGMAATILRSRFL